jgi:hypothetical protein
MALPNANFDDVVTTTLRKRTKRLRDNVSNNTALLMRLKERGRMRTFSGGRTIVEEIAFAGPGNYTRYSGYDPINISQGDMLTAAEFNIKQAAVAISMSGLEELQNRGEEQTIELLGARIEQAEREMTNGLSTDIYSDGTASGGKQVGGLQLLVSDDGTGTVGGIVSGTYTWWLNQVYDFSAASGTPTPGVSTIQTAMNTLYLACSRNRDQPDLIVADNTYFQFYWASLQSIQRVTNEKMAAAGFQNLKFMGADVVFDGGLNGSAPSSHMYFLNSDFLHWRPHADRNIEVLRPDRHATNQDAFVRLIGWAGNLTTSGRQFQGVIVD